MRIAYVCADGGIAVFGEKGVSVHITAMAQAFSRTGNEVRMLCARRGRGTADYPVEEVTPDPLPTRRPRGQGTRAHRHRHRDRGLVVLHQGWPFDLLYERYPLWSTAGVRAARHLGVPVVVAVNAPLVAEQAEFRALMRADEARAIEREVLRRADALAVVSDELGAYVTARGATADRVHVIRNAVDTACFHPQVPPSQLPGVSDDAFVVGFSGSLKAWHGLDALLPAFRVLLDHLPSAHLLVVGEGPRKPWVEGYADGAGLKDAITLTGWIGHDDLPGLLRQADRRGQRFRTSPCGHQPCRCGSGHGSQLCPRCRACPRIGPDRRCERTGPAA